MTHKKQTAVEWLMENLHTAKEPFAKAKEIEKQQIMDAYDKGEFNDGMNETAEQYYIETYGN